MTKPNFMLLITLLVFAGCKKDEPVAFYPKTLSQTYLSSAYEFRVRDQVIQSPPPPDSFYASVYLNNELSDVSLTLLNTDTLRLDWGGRTIDYRYMLRNDTLYIARRGPSQGFDPPLTVWTPFAYGNPSQFTMVRYHFSNTPLSLQDSLHNWPFEVPSTFSYQDYHFYTDTAALLTVTRILN